MRRRDLSKALIASAGGAALLPQSTRAARSDEPDHRRTRAERAAGVEPTNYAHPPGDVRRYGAVPGTSQRTHDATCAFQAALDCGYSPRVPAGSYGISATLVTRTDNQVLTGLGGNATLYKYANVPILSILHRGSGAVNVNFCGAHDGFALLRRPANARAVTDTTDNVTIGKMGSGAPFAWLLDQVESNNAGRDGIHHDDGPAGKIGVLSCAYNARWGFWCQRIQILPGGSALDTSHVSAQYLHCFHNGRGNYEEGGNIFLQGNAFVLNGKSFGAWGDGLRVDGIYNRVWLFTELDGATNKDIAPWMPGQTISVGDFRRHLKSCY